MGFTTTIKKKADKAEKYPEVPVMTQKAINGQPKGNTIFELNAEAMRLFGFPMSTANVSKITIGYNDNQDIALAAINLENTYTSNITAKNTFSNKKLLERLVKVFDVEPNIDNEFVLLFDERVEGEPITACLALILPETNDIMEDNGTLDDQQEVETVEAIIEPEVIEVAPEEAPGHSMDDIPMASQAFENREQAFESASPHVVKVGVPAESIVDKDNWE